MSLTPEDRQAVADAIAPINAALGALHLAHDTRLLAASLLGYAGRLYSIMQAAGVITPAQIEDLFQASKGTAMATYSRPVTQCTTAAEARLAAMHVEGKPN